MLNKVKFTSQLKIHCVMRSLLCGMTWNRLNIQGIIHGLQNWLLVRDHFARWWPKNFICNIVKRHTKRSVRFTLNGELLGSSGNSLACAQINIISRVRFNNILRNGDNIHVCICCFGHQDTRLWWCLQWNFKRLGMSDGLSFLGTQSSLLTGTCFLPLATFSLTTFMSLWGYSEQQEVTLWPIFWQWEQKSRSHS